MKYYFEYPFVLIALLLPIGYLIWRYTWYENIKLVASVSYSPERFLGIKNRWRWLRWLPVLCSALALTLMILALARPRVAEGIKEKTDSGIDIMMAVDVSASMETKDLKPNRMAVARNFCEKFIRMRPNDRIGIALFARDAFAYAPLTLDKDFLFTQVKTLTTEIMPKEGTALGPAIMVGINHLTDTLSKSKVIILITDGVHNCGDIDPINASMLAAREDIRIYPIGIGKEKYLDNLNEEDVKEVKTELDEETLRKIAQITQGKFFRATDQNSLDEASLYINQLEKGSNQDPQYKNIEDRYLPFALGALVLMLLVFVLRFLGYYNTLEG